jgi:hypothetical protein
MESPVVNIQTIVENANQSTVGSIAGSLSLLTLIWGSTNVFAHLQKALNAVWDVKVKSDAGIKQTLRFGHPAIGVRHAHGTKEQHGAGRLSSLDFYAPPSIGQKPIHSSSAP